MRKYDLRKLIAYDDQNFLPKVLINDPGYRLLLLNMRSGQKVPEHATKDAVTIYAHQGHITCYENKAPIDLTAGEVLCLDSDIPHSLVAHEDSFLLAVAAGNTISPPMVKEQLDLRNVARPLRHPLVFSRFDGLATGDSFELTNDHDPIPLNRQMEAMRPGQVKRRYITRGPDIFHIQIRRIAASIRPEV